MTQRQRQRLRHLVFVVAGLALGVLGAELVVRLYSVIGGAAGRELANRDPLAVRFVPHGRFGYRQRPNGHQPFWNGTQANWNALGYRGPEVSLPKPPGTYRIVLLGGSTTHGYGVDDDETIDAHMRRILAARFPGRRFEVVNLALGGYDSYQLLERMTSDGVRFEPDLVIINSGINDVRNAPHRDIQRADPRTLLWEANMSRMREELERGGASLWTRLNHYSYLVRLPGYVRSRLSIAPRVTSGRVAVPHDDAVEYFASNIRETAELARSSGADVLLSTPASSLSTRHRPDDVSDNGYWIVDAATTENYRRRLAARLEALAAELSESGPPVPYVYADLPPELFLDDCHLTGAGNRAVAERFVDAIAPLLGP